MYVHKYIPLISRYPASASKHPLSLKQLSGIIILGASISMMSSISPAIGRAASSANLFILAAIIGLNVEEVEEELAVAVFDVKPGILWVTSGDMNIPSNRPTHSSFQVASIGRIFNRNVLLPLRLSIEIKSFGSVLSLTLLSFWWTEVELYDGKEEEEEEEVAEEEEEEVTGMN